MSNRPAEAAGRDTSALQIVSSAPVYLSEDMEENRTHTRWFPAMVGNHVADLVEKYHDGAGIPQDFLDYIEGRKGYDYHQHGNLDADHLDFVTPEITDRLGVFGPVEKQIEKIEKLRDVGVTQFNIYLMCGDEENIVAQYGKHVIPAFKGG